MLNLFKKNKNAQFNTLYHTYSERLYLLVLRYVVFRFDAEEVLQRGFIKVYEGLGNFKQLNDKATLGWLSRIMVNESLLFLREQKRLILSDYADDEAQSILLMPDAEDELAYESCLRLVSNLPVGYRAVFNLYAIEGYAHKEIAVMLNITESASRSQLARARQQLKEQLKALNYENERIG